MRGLLVIAALDITPMPSLPVIDLRDPDSTIAIQVANACRAHGFFYIVGHGIGQPLIDRLQHLSHQFFALPEAVKAQYAMALGGPAWRGWFGLGSELTSGRPDWKEGLYLGSELGADHPRVAAGVPMHGRNLIPDDAVLSGFRSAIFDYMDAATQVGHRVMSAMARSLQLDADYFASRYTADPLILLRIFLYPSRSPPAGSGAEYGVGEHTDYGLLTLLHQDEVGGLQIRSRQGWIDAPPLPGSLVVNIGDMLDRMTGGEYRSTPHRVRINRSGRNRLSIPLFFDPDFDARIEAIGSPHSDDAASRWDGASVHRFEGSYGDYLLGKVGRVFPELAEAVKR